MLPVARHIEVEVRALLLFLMSTGGDRIIFNLNLCLLTCRTEPSSFFYRFVNFCLP